MFKIFNLSIVCLFFCILGTVQPGVLNNQTENSKSVYQSHKFNLNETPLFEYSQRQDPDTSLFLKNIEEKFFGVSLKKISNRDLHKRETNDHEQCENPDQEYLESLLSEYQIHYRKFEETVLKSKLDPTQDQSLTSLYTNQNGMEPESAENDLNSRFIDQTQCNPDDRNMTNLNQQSICPWRYMITGKILSIKFIY